MPSLGRYLESPETENIPKMVEAGGDWLVAGSSSVFSTEAPRKDNMARAMKAAAEGLAARTPKRAASAA